jgi:hypothetical protein
MASSCDNFLGQALETGPLYSGYEIQRCAPPLPGSHFVNDDRRDKLRAEPLMGPRCQAGHDRGRITMSSIAIDLDRDDGRLVEQGVDEMLHLAAGATRARGRRACLPDRAPAPAAVD